MTGQNGRNTKNNANFSYSWVTIKTWKLHGNQFSKV